MKIRKFENNKDIQRQDKMLYEKPTEYTMKNRGNTIYCPKCKHTVEFWTNDNKELCTWCNNYVFKTKKDEFKYRVEQRLKNARK